MTRRLLVLLAALAAYGCRDSGKQIVACPDVKPFVRVAECHVNCPRFQCVNPCIPLRDVCVDTPDGPRCGCSVDLLR